MYFQRLTYHISHRITGDVVHVIRCVTREEIESILEALPTPEAYGPVKSVTVCYSDALDLIDQCASGMEWENKE